MCLLRSLYLKNTIRKLDVGGPSGEEHAVASAWALAGDSRWRGGGARVDFPVLKCERLRGAPFVVVI